MPHIDPGTRIGPDGKRYPEGSPELDPNWQPPDPGSVEVTMPPGVATEASVLAIAEAIREEVTTTATLTAGESLTVTVPAGASEWLVQTSGSFTGNLHTEGTLDRTNWVKFNYRQTQTGKMANIITTPGIFRGNCAGMSEFRVRASGALTGAATVHVKCSKGVGPVFQNAFTEVRSLAQYYASTAGGNVLFMASTGERTMAATTDQDVAAFSNPANSGVDVYVEKFSYGTNKAGRMKRYRSPTITGLTTESSWTNRGGGTNVPAARMYLPPFTVSATGTLGFVHYLGTNDQISPEIHGGLILRPGQGFLWRWTPDAGQTGVISIEVVWWETGAVT